MITLQASGTRSGSQPLDGCALAQFQYWLNAPVGEAAVLGCGDLSSASISAEIQVPSRRTGTFEISAFLWNCGDCDVYWVYEAQEVRVSQD